MTIWVTADLHLNHFGILSYRPTFRPWNDVHAMNEAIIEMWRRLVAPTDEVWVLGDFGFKNTYGTDIGTLFGALPGRKHLIVGNHDEQNPIVMKQPWASIADMGKIRSEGQSAVLCHYPIESWAGAEKGRLHFHGHTHGTLKRRTPHRFDVGLDAVGAGELIAFETLCQIADTQTWVPVDHHGTP